MLRFVPLLLTGCAWMLPRADPGEVCGDGEWTGLEACDPEDPTYGPWCKDDCTWHVCGDGLVGAEESCDGTAGCSDNCTLASCGNGAVDPGELCLEAGSVLATGALADLALGDADGDGDPDLLVAASDGLRVWFDDGGVFTRSGRVIEAAGIGAVGALGRDLYAVSGEALLVARWNGASHTVERVPFAAEMPCTNPRGGTLSTGTYGVSTYVSWTCDEGGFIGNDPPWLAVPGAQAARSRDVFENTAVRTLFAPLAEPYLVANSVDAPVVELPAPARALRAPAAIDLGLDTVAITNDGFVVIGGTAVTAEIPASQVIDGTIGWWDSGTLGVYDLDAVYLVHEGLRVRLDDGTVHEGPAIGGLTRLLVVDFDQDGFLDVAAYRPASEEVLLWMQRP